METNSKEFDTIRLLQECDAGSKMAVSAIDDVLDHTQDSALKNRCWTPSSTMPNSEMTFTPNWHTVMVTPRSQVRSQKEWLGRKPI